MRTRPPEDPELEMELQVLRQHNSSLMPLKGRRIYATVIKAGKKFIYVDPGFKKVVKLPRKVLKLWDVVIQSTDPTPRVAADDFKVGDRLILIIEEVEGPFGDMILAPSVPHKTDLHAQVWEELEEHARAGKVVMGRVLNEVKGGLSVGIAGFVAFCPFSQINLSNALRIGVLQPFYINRMDSEAKNVVVFDATEVDRRANLLRMYQRPRDTGRGPIPMGFRSGSHGGPRGFAGGSGDFGS
eukprot:jgi/Botrbrau1/9806/Bobra.0322s0013.1